MWNDRSYRQKAYHSFLKMKTAEQPNWADRIHCVHYEELCCTLYCSVNRTVEAFISRRQNVIYLR